MGLQEFPSKPVNKGGVIFGTVNGPTEIAIGAQDSYLVADSTTTPGAKWQTYRKYNTVQLTSGTSWTVPATVEMIDVFLIGGGQGGRGVSTSATANANNSSSGGAGGAMLYVRNYPVTPGAAITYSIGSGGAGGTNPAPTASTSTMGSAGGNTTFGSLVAPGARSRTGAYYGWANSSITRGVYDLNPSLSADYQGGTIASTNLPDGAGLPLSSLDWRVVGSMASNATSWFEFSFPFSSFDSSNPINRQQRSMGFGTTYSRLLSSFTAPTGSTSTQELTANLQLSGWGGYGSQGVATTSPYVGSMTFHGGGQGSSLNTSTTTTRALIGGAAAANSGAGGGGSAVMTSTTTVNGVTGGAGGSGVIFIGYWA